MDEIEEKISRILRYMGIPYDEVRPEASFVNDFEFNEFQFNCLVYYILNYYDIQVAECDYPKLSTIGNTIEFIRNEKMYLDYPVSPAKTGRGYKKAICYLP